MLGSFQQKVRELANARGQEDVSLSSHLQVGETPHGPAPMNLVGN